MRCFNNEARVRCFNNEARVRCFNNEARVRCYLKNPPLLHSRCALAQEVCWNVQSSGVVVLVGKGLLGLVLVGLSG